MAMQCEICGASPAARIKLRRGVGLVLVHRVYKAEVDLCARCAEEATAHFQKETVKKGWTSPRALVFNPVYLASNKINQSRHRRRLGESPASTGGSARRTKPSADSVHPIDAIVSFAPKDPVLRGHFTSMILDFTGGGLSSRAEAMEAIHAPLQESEGEVVLELSESLVDCARMRGDMGDGLVHATFLVLTEDLVGRPYSQASELELAVVAASAGAVFDLVGRGLEDEARSAAVIGALLFKNANEWFRLSGR